MSREVDDYQAEVRRLRSELNELRAEVGDDRALRAVNAKPRRLTLTDVLERHLDALGRGGAEHSMVRLARNARGDAQFEVTVRTGETADVATVGDALRKARTVYDALCLAYPQREGDDTPASGGAKST